MQNPDRFGHTNETAGRRGADLRSVGSQTFSLPTGPQSLGAKTEEHSHVILRQAGRRPAIRQTGGVRYGDKRDPARGSSAPANHLTFPFVFLLLAAVFSGPARAGAASTNDLTAALQKGLFEEEANHNLEAAIQAYQGIAVQFDRDRKLAATAIFRLGECYRKQGLTNQAAAQYERIVREFSEQAALATLSRAQLAGAAPANPRSANPPPEDSTAWQSAARSQAEQLRLQIEEIKRPGFSQRERATVLQQISPDAVLASLAQKLAETEQRLATLQTQYGPDHADVVTTKELIRTLDKQLESQIQAVLLGLEIKRDSLAKAAAMTEGRSEAAAAAPPSAATSAEAEEIKRIREMIQNSPDLINTWDGDGFTPLQKAARAGQTGVAQFLLENGADTEKTVRNSGATALFLAASSGHRAMVELLLDHKADIQAANKNGVTSLQIASECGFKSVVEALLARGAAIDTAEQRGETALHKAARSGNKAIIETLLAKGAEINAKDAGGATPLVKAIVAKQAAAVRALLAAKAAVNFSCDTLLEPESSLLPSVTPLDLAIVARSEALVQILLESGADPNIPAASDGDTALHWAVRSEPTAIQILLEHKADPNLSNRKGYTPLSLAIQDRLPSNQIELLLSHGANPNVRCPWKSLYMLHAVVSVDQPDLVNRLIAAGADLEARDPDGATALVCAAQTDRTNAFIELLRHSPNLNLPDNGSNTAAHYAVGRPEMLKALLAAKPEVNARNSEGETPLHWAAGARVRESVAALLAAGADPNAQDANGNSPLHWAVLEEEGAVVDALLAGGADPNLRNRAGQTPLDFTKNRPSWIWRGITQSISLPRIDRTWSMPMGSGTGLRPSRSPGFPQALPLPSRIGISQGSAEIAEALKRRGALDDLPKPDRIQLCRPSSGYSAAIFTKGSNDWNQFTLLELVAVHYQLLSTSPGPEAANRTTAASLHDWGLAFPDWAHVRIRRPGADLKSWREFTADLTPVLDAGDAAKDVPLKWGDVVAIPELDHSLNETWAGFSNTQLDNLKKCLTRRLTITIKGKATPYLLSPRIESMPASPSLLVLKAPYCVKPALHDSNLLLVSSDLSRVKLTRLDPLTGRRLELVLDCRESMPGPELWLREGDALEVPEKP